MNTQAHLLINLFVQHKWTNAKSKYFTLAVILGALLPDIPMFFFFIWYTVFSPTAQNIIWETLYFDASWKLFFNIFNSIPVVVVLLIIGIVFKKQFLTVFSISTLLHLITDLLLHVDDGHAHFLPFTSWVFSSPVSYWDPRYFGGIFSVIEFLMVLVSAIYLWKYYTKWWARMLIVLATVLSALSVLGTWFFFA